MKEWFPTGKYGLRYRQHETESRGVGRSKRPLRYYVAVYKHAGKTVTDVYGWEGVDFKNEDEVVATALQLRQNRKCLQPPFTLKELLARRQAEIDKKIRLDSEEEKRQQREDNIRFARVFSLYCEAHTEKKSLVDEQGYYRSWIGPAIGEKRLPEIILLDLERIRKKMVAAGRAPRSIQYVKSIIRQVYHFAADRGLFSGEPPTTKFLRNLKIDNKRLRYLEPEESEQLLAEIRKHSEQTYRVALLSLNSGMRFGEIAALRWQHINSDRREILVMDPKNGQSRSVYMTSAVVAMFSEIQRGRQDEIVFPARQVKGEPVRPMDRPSNVFAKAVDTLGLNDGITDRRTRIVFHSLRHSCASWLVNAGVELPVIAKILGHKTLAMTMRYSHVNDQSVKNAMAVLDTQPTPRIVKNLSMKTL